MKKFVIVLLLLFTLCGCVDDSNLKDGFKEDVSDLADDMSNMLD